MRRRSCLPAPPAATRVITTLPVALTFPTGWRCPWHYADVAREGGHNEIVLRRYYERRVTTREAREYFALTPSRV
jgi:hypothetical protein